MDIRRTVLWMIFPSRCCFFGTTGRSITASRRCSAGPRPQPPPPTASNSRRRQQRHPLGAERARQCHAVRPDLGGARFGRSAAPARSEEVVVTTDVLRLTFDTMGAQLVRAELLKYPATGQADKPTVLLDRSAGRELRGADGVVGAPDGQSFPTRRPRSAWSRPSASSAATALVVAFEGESGGLKVTKTFTLHRGRLRHRRARHDLANVGAAAVKPSLYLQLERDGNDPADTSSFYHVHRHRGLLGTGQVPEDDLQRYREEEGQLHQTGRQRLDRHRPALLRHRLGAAARQAAQQRSGRGAEEPYAARSIEAGEAPGAASRVDSHLWVGRRTRRPWPRWLA